MASDRPSSDIVFEREAEHQHGDERGEHRDRQRQAGDHRRAPRVEEQEHDEHGEQRAFDERRLDVLDRGLDAGAGVADDRSARRRAAASSGARDLLARRASLTVGRAVAFRLLDLDADRIAVVEERRRARLLGAVVDRGHVGEPDDAAVAARPTTSCAELGGRLRRPRRRMVRSSSAPCRRPTGAARFCACSACDHLADADARRLHRLRVQLDGHLALDAADDADLGDAADAAQFVRDAGVGDLRELRAGQRRSRSAPA